jgi:hypothetical protein
LEIKYREFKMKIVHKQISHTWTCQNCYTSTLNYWYVTLYRIITFIGSIIKQIHWYCPLSTTNHF